MIAHILFWLSALILYYIYDGYRRVLRLASRRGAGLIEDERLEAAAPPVTILITAFNEEREIVQRIHNVLTPAYPADRIEVLVASDGSTDRTNELVRGIADPRVRLVVSPARQGKSATQNLAIRDAHGEIVIFTDVDTRFDPAFVREIVRPFGDPRVGGVDGRLGWSFQHGNVIAHNQGYYWRYELALRSLESRLGILAVASGACLAVRRRLLRPIPTGYGEDCVVPLDVVAQGYRMVHAERALATASSVESGAEEFRARVRMTVRNWQGTWSRKGLLNPLTHPRIAFSLWSHKLLRWLSPIFVMTMLVSAHVLAFSADASPAWAVLTDVFCVLGILGGLADWGGWKLRWVGGPYSFLLANTGFLVGLLAALAGRQIRVYKKA